jgi:hypothetical protein
MLPADSARMFRISSGNQFLQSKRRNGENLQNSQTANDSRAQSTKLLEMECKYSDIHEVMSEMLYTMCF